MAITSPLGVRADRGGQLRLSFRKYHGLGNDFLIIDARARDLAALRAAAPQLCDRHRGVGADGLLLLLRHQPRPAMRVINADGSVPEMCGNGLRCFVQWLDDAGMLVPALQTQPMTATAATAAKAGAGGASASADGADDTGGRATAADVDGDIEVDVADIDTDAGTLRCRVHRDAAGRVAEVEVRMGAARFAPSAVPLVGTQPLIDGPLEVAGQTLRGTALSVGNPHLVLFQPFEPAERARLGPLLERHPRFPARVNVEFCVPLSADADGLPRLRVDVYERGCGWTQACGTGATAAVLAAVELGRHPRGAPMRVQLPGGWLTITVGGDGVATMRGPTCHVFDGEVEVAAG